MSGEHVAPWVIHLDADDFMIQVERAADPSLRERPVVVGGQSVTTGVVAAASREARACGVRAGMLLAQARHRCPGAAYVAGALDRYLAAAAAVDEIARRDADLVEWTALDQAVLTPRDLGGSLATLRLTVERIRDGASRELGLTLAVGAATSRTAARLAARLARPSGVVLVLSGYEEQFLAPFDLGLLEGLPAWAQSRLRARGIETLGQFTTQAPNVLREIVGLRAGALVEQARGRDMAMPGSSARVPRSLSRTVRFTAPILTLEQALPLMRVVIAELLRTARDQGYYAGSLSVRAEGGGRRVSRAVTFRSPTMDETECHAAAGALLRRIWRGLEGPAIEALCGSLGELSAVRGQLSLFESDANARRPRPPGRGQWDAFWAARIARHPDRGGAC